MTFSEALEHLKAGKMVRNRNQEVGKVYKMIPSGYIREYVLSMSIMENFLYLEALNVLNNEWEVVKE